MRHAAVIIVLLLLGCTQPTEPVESFSVPSISSPPADVPQSPIAPLANDSEIAFEVEANITAVPIPTNETANETLNETNETSTTNTRVEPSGLVFGSEKYVLVLDDLILDETEPGGVCAAVQVYDRATIQSLGQEKLCKQRDVVWISPEGRAFRFRLIATGAGYSYAAKWAEIRIFG